MGGITLGAGAWVSSAVSRSCSVRWGGRGPSGLCRVPSSRTPIPQALSWKAPEKAPPPFYRWNNEGPEHSHRGLNPPGCPCPPSTNSCQHEQVPQCWGGGSGGAPADDLQAAVHHVRHSHTFARIKRSVVPPKGLAPCAGPETEAGPPETPALLPACLRGHLSPSLCNCAHCAGWRPQGLRSHPPRWPGAGAASTSVSRMPGSAGTDLRRSWAPCALVRQGKEEARGLAGKRGTGEQPGRGGALAPHRARGKSQACG